MVKQYRVTLLVDGSMTVAQLFKTFEGKSVTIAGIESQNDETATRRAEPRVQVGRVVVPRSRFMKLPSTVLLLTALKTNGCLTQKQIEDIFVAEGFQASTARRVLDRLKSQGDVVFDNKRSGFIRV